MVVTNFEHDFGVCGDGNCILSPVPVQIEEIFS